MIKSINVEEMHREFADFAARAFNGKEAYLIRRDGVVIAALIGEADFFGMLEALITCREIEEADVGGTVN